MRKSKKWLKVPRKNRERGNSMIIESGDLGTAEIPELRKPESLAEILEDYRDFPETQLWRPNNIVEASIICHYKFMAKGIMTIIQEAHGVSNDNAMENACAGPAEQYLWETLHIANYNPKVALRKILTLPLPERILTNWPANDNQRFVEAITKYGKNFQLIKKFYFPEKDMTELVHYYYIWKSSDEGKALLKTLISTKARRRRHKNKRHLLSKFLSRVYGKNPVIGENEMVDEKNKENKRNCNSGYDFPSVA